MYLHAMRSVAAVLACGVSILILSGAGHAPPPRMATFTTEQRAQLARLSGYLNSIHTLKGGFVQIDPNGDLEQGEFYLAKPGRMRFEYHPPSPTLVVSDGDTVAIKNNKLKTVDRYPLTDTPLDLILSDKIDLNISIVFAEQPLELRQWTVVDAQGLPTTVALRDVQSGADLPGSLFVLRDEKSPFARKSQE